MSQDTKSNVVDLHAVRVTKTLVLGGLVRFTDDVIHTDTGRTAARKGNIGEVLAAMAQL